MKIEDFEVENRCYYCGMSADSIDHVIPRSILLQINSLNPMEVKRFVNTRAMTVPSCRECNSLLGASYQPTLALRKRELKKRLEKRYKKYLSLPAWDDGETMELGPNLRSKIEESMKIRLIIETRLQW